MIIEYFPSNINLPEYAKWVISLCRASDKGFFYG